MVPFAGWEMPVQYPTGILAEHHAVRTGAGIFDVSHMGEFEITGPDRNAFVNRVTSNDVCRLEPGGVQYSALLTPEGTFVDDCTVYRFDDKLMIVVNASNTARAWEHIVGAEGRDQRPAQGHLARGRAAGGAGAAAPRRCSSRSPTRRSAHIAYYHFDVGKIAGAQCFVSRTGYTGEDGFELYCRERDTVALWDAITAAGAQPIGLGARDSLRLEMGYALYGNEIDDTITPLEAGLGWIVKLDKGAPLPRRQDALRAQKQRGVTRQLVGFRLEGRGFPRHGYPIYHDGPRGGHRPERHPEPVARRRHRHDLSARRRRQARHPVRGRVPRRAAAGGGGGAAVLDEGKREEVDGEDGDRRRGRRGTDCGHFPLRLLRPLRPSPSLEPCDSPS